MIRLFLFCLFCGAGVLSAVLFGWDVKLFYLVGKMFVNFAITWRLYAIWCKQKNPHSGVDNSGKYRVCCGHWGTTYMQLLYKGMYHIRLQIWYRWEEWNAYEWFHSHTKFSGKQLLAGFFLGRFLLANLSGWNCSCWVKRYFLFHDGAIYLITISGGRLWWSQQPLRSTFEIVPRYQKLSSQMLTLHEKFDILIQK